MNVVYNCDCMEYMKDIEDKCFDLTLTDPPYNVGLDYNSYNDNKDDYYEWCDIWFKELLRISDTVVFTPGFNNIKHWIKKDYKEIIIWIKKKFLY